MLALLRLFLLAVAAVGSIDFGEHPALRRGAPMPSLPAAIHRVDSADLAPPVPSVRPGALRRANPSLASGWITKVKK
jgi:hypothetical protein